MIRLVILTVSLSHLVTSVIFRFQPPSPRKNQDRPIQGQKYNLIRRRFKNQAPIQIPTIDFCQNYSFADKLCTKCYEGFVLDNNSCSIDPNFGTEKKWNQPSFIKISSPSKSNKELDKILLNANPFCSSVTPDGALCLSCYKTHKLDNGNCIENEDDFTLAEQLYLRPMQVPANTFCRIFDSNGNCISCFPQSTFNGSQCVLVPRHDLDCRLHQFCVPKSTQCLTYSTEGICKSCPYDAININGICRINKPQSLCIQIDQNEKCKKCSTLGHLDGGVCRFKTPNCLQYNSDKITCNTCLPTFRRQNGECVRASKIMFINTDSNCATWKEGVCIQCKFGFGFYEKYCFDIQELRKQGISPDNNVIEF